VFNHLTYPNLVRLFERFGVAEQDADMSFSVHCDDPDVEWKGQDLDTFFAQRGNLLNLSHWGLLADIVRMSLLADKYRDDPSLEDVTLGEFLAREHFGSGFSERYVVPMVSAIWSAPTGQMLDFPAATFIRFFDNHRMLRVTDLVDVTEGAHWRSVLGGSRHYVDALAARVSGETFTRTQVSRVERTDGGVEVTLPDGSVRSYDQVVMATHGQPTLALLSDPTPREREVLGAFGYRPNVGVLHTDSSLLPERERAHAAWNYYARECRLDNRDLSVTYYLNKLQRLPVSTPVMLTVNPPRDIAAKHVMAAFEFEHPLFDREAMAMQKRIPEIQGVDRIWYAGAWQRYGFHEDGLLSAVRLADRFDIRTPWADELDATAEHELDTEPAASAASARAPSAAEPDAD
jgi:predicted NAD/FAD-binding protein